MGEAICFLREGKRLDREGSMFSKLHERLGTAGLVIAVVALVAALAGTAFAAVGLSGQQKKEVKKIAKQFAGKPGATGPQGPVGTVGPQGATGKDGANGKDGQNGAPGAPGAPGASVELVNEAPSSCAAGGFTYEIAGSGEENEVCNGAAGGGGSGTLEPGEEEQGVWSLAASQPLASKATVYSSIQFSRALPSSPKLTYLSEEVPTSECPGSYEAPDAHAETTKPALCVYANPYVGPFPEGGPSLAFASPSGLVQEWQLAPESQAAAWGTWAVEVPSAP
jgi:Collagen triple helix repeat (20 copies)